MSVRLTDMKRLSSIQEKTYGKIVEGAVDLMSERGFHRVTVQEIGEKVGLCEKTVFRYFPSKTELLAAIIESKSYADELWAEFEKKRKWDVRHDFPLMARMFFNLMKAKRKTLRAYLSALDSIDMDREDYLKDSLKIQGYLTGYMLDMQRRGKVRDGDAEVMARALINILRGYLLMFTLNDNEKIWQEKVESMRMTLHWMMEGMAFREEEKNHN